MGKLIYDRIKSIEQVNKDWFSRQIEDLKTKVIKSLRRFNVTI